jgi:hypothetical protein
VKIDVDGRRIRCRFPGCANPEDSRGLCNAHYLRARRGDRDALAHILPSQHFGSLRAERIRWCECGSRRQPGPGWWFIGCDRCGRMIRPEERVAPKRRRKAG